MIFKDTDTENLTDSEVLFFIRNTKKEDFFKKNYPISITKIFKNVKKFHTISEYNNSDYYIDLNKIEINNIRHSDLLLIDKIINIDEVIVRCRGLREISYSESKELIWKATKYFIDLFEYKSELKLIVSLAIDNYVMDIMSRVANYFEIKHLELTRFFIPGYYRVIERGIGVKVRSVSEKEIINVCEYFYKERTSDMVVSRKIAINNAIRDYISYIARYYYYYIYNYKIKNQLNYGYRFAKYLRGFNKLKKLKAYKYFDEKNDIKNLNKDQAVYIPLHYHPEATVDYWSKEKETADYLNALIKIIIFLKKRDKVVVFKEHPNFYLRRDTEFYKTLKKFDDIYILNPYEKSQDIAELIENIIVHTGSVGFESLMVNKKVYIATENYYSMGILPNYKNIEDEYSFLNENQKLDLVRKVLETCIQLDD